MTDFQCDFSAPTVIKALKFTFDVTGAAFNPDCPILILAQMCERANTVLGTPAGTATPLQPVQVFNDEDELFGERCEASLAVKRIRALNRNAKIWVQPLPETGSYDRWTVTFGADLPVAVPTVKSLMVGGEIYRVTIRPGDTANDVAKAFREEINDDAGAGWFGAVNGDVLTIRANTPGIASAFNVRNEYCRFGITPTVGCDLVNTVMASGTPDIEEALDLLGNECFCDVVMPYNDIAALIAFREWLCEQWAACSDCYTRGYGFAGNGILADEIADTLATNSPHLMMIGATNFDEQPATLLAAVAAEVQPQLVNDPYKPVDCLSVRGLTPPDKEEVPPETIIDAAAIDGLTHLQTLADGSVQINVGVSSYTYDSGGQADLSYQNFNNLAVYRNAALYLKKCWADDFGDAVSVDDNFIPVAGQEIINPVISEGWGMGKLAEMAGFGWHNPPQEGDWQSSRDERCCLNHNFAIRPLAPSRCVNFNQTAILKGEAA